MIASFRDVNNLQLAHRKECTLGDLEHGVESNGIYNIHIRRRLLQIKSLLSVRLWFFLDLVLRFWSWNKIIFSLTYRYVLSPRALSRFSLRCVCVVLHFACL